MNHFLKVSCKTYNILFFIALLFLTQIGLGQINADFSSPNVSGCNILQTKFFDQSTSDASIIGWVWDLDGTTSQEQNPGSLFTDAGTYTICLTVTDVNGNSDTECKENFITIFENPVADFVVDKTEGCAPVTVFYSDNSVSSNGNIDSWLWDVGGSAGVVSQVVGEDFSSIYSVQGSFTTSLTVVDEQGCTDTAIKPNLVNVSTILTPDVSIELIPTCELPWEILFKNENFDPLVEYTWDFGNGNTFVGEQPPHITYTDAGIYDVTIFMQSGECTDTVVLSNFVNTNTPAAFSFSPEVICQNKTVQFTDESLNEADQVLWDFGDGFTSTDANPAHTYNTPGCFDINLIRTVGTCIDTATYSCVSILELPEVDFEIQNQFPCVLPSEVILHANVPSSGSLIWEFIDNGIISSHDTNDVAIVIEEEGVYFARLHYLNESGCGTTLDSIPIEIGMFELNEPLVPIEGCAPLTFTLEDSVFTDINIISHEWSIGEFLGFESTLASPTFTIVDTGRYDLQLIAENVFGCIDTIFIENYIRVGNKPIADFTSSSLEACVGQDISFTDLSSDFTDSWGWQFENAISTVQNPTFSYNDADTLDVSLYAGHNGCFDTIAIADYITILEPVSEFEILYNCEDPYTVEIVNHSTGADSLFWTLSLSETEIITFTDSLFGVYTFPDRGKYALSHYSKNFDSGCEHIFEDTIRIVEPIASYALDTLRGCTPFTLEIGDFSQDAFTYEFQSDIANIDSIFNSEPKITFTEGGVLASPLLIITDIHECQDSFQLVDSLLVNKLEAIIDFNDIICIPDVAEFNDQSTTIFSSITSWEWDIMPVGFSSIDQNTSLYIDSVGLYDLSFRVEDDWGCLDSIMMPMAINGVEVIPDFRFDTLGCTSAPINFVAQGQTEFIDAYEWDFGDGNISNQQNPKYTYSTEGLYTVCLTMTDLRGCSKTTCKENIIEILNPVANFSGDPITAFCPPLLTTFENLSTNATSFEWEFGDNSGKSLIEAPSHVYTSPGSYNLTLIAESTPVCRDTLFRPDYINVEGPVGSFVANVGETCLPIDVTLAAMSDDYYTYIWDLGNGILDTVPGNVIEDSISYSYDIPGRYIPKLIIADSAGCVRSFAGKSINVDLVSLDFKIDIDTICGPPLSVSIENLSEGTTEDVNYLWLVTGPDSFESVDKNPTFDIQQAGQYDVSIIGEYGNCIDTFEIERFLDVGSNPEVTFEILADELCDDVVVSFMNNSNVDFGEFNSWLWDFGDGNFSDEMNPTHQYKGVENQTIKLTGSTDKGCEGVFTASFDVLPSTVAIVEEDRLICIGDQVEISGRIENLQVNGSFHWESEGDLKCTDCLSQVVMPTETTSYILVGIHPNGCESRDTQEVIVIQSPGPELSLIADSIICLGAETTIEVVNFNQNYTYEWDTNVLGQDCYVNCEMVNVSPADITTYYVTVINEFGCFKEDSVTIDVEFEIEDILIEESGICFGEETTIEIMNGNNPKWTTNSDITCESCPENIVSPESTTTYYVSVNSDLGCLYEDSISIVVVPSNSADAGLDVDICLGEATSLSANGFGSSTWTGANIISDSTNNTITAAPVESQYYYLKKTLYECEQSDSVFVSVSLKADIQSFGDTICPGDRLLISATGKADNYIWTIDSEEIEGGEIEVFPTITTDYRVIGSYRTCEQDTSIATVTVLPMIDYRIEEDFYNIFLNDQINILPEYDLNRSYSFDWVPDIGLDCSDCPDPIIKGITESVDYSVLVIDENTDCQIEEIISVRFNNECTNTIFHLPNIFSPNGDGQNDSWKMYTTNAEEFVSMSVYDRYGNLVFHSEDINKPWDGQFNGQNVGSGVYVYRAKLICPYNNSEYQIVGDVTVVR